MKVKYTAVELIVLDNWDLETLLKEEILLLTHFFLLLNTLESIATQRVLEKFNKLLFMEKSRERATSTIPPKNFIFLTNRKLVVKTRIVGNEEFIDRFEVRQQVVCRKLSLLSYQTQALYHSAICFKTHEYFSCISFFVPCARKGEKVR